MGKKDWTAVEEVTWKLFSLISVEVKLDPLVYVLKNRSKVRPGGSPWKRQLRSQTDRCYILFFFFLKNLVESKWNTTFKKDRYNSL